MPITRPRGSTSGPPELPGRISASCWIHWVKPARSVSPPSSSTSESSEPVKSVNTRWAFETMPSVTDEERANGLPSASTGSPIASGASTASRAGRRPSAGSAAFGNGRSRPALPPAAGAAETDRSVSGSWATTSASTIRPSVSVQRIRVLLPATWKLVSTCPASDDDHAAAGAREAHRAAFGEIARHRRDVDQRRVDRGHGLLHLARGRHRRPAPPPSRPRRSRSRPDRRRQPTQRSSHRLRRRRGATNRTAPATTARPARPLLHPLRRLRCAISSSFSSPLAASQCIGRPDRRQGESGARRARDSPRAARR